MNKEEIWKPVRGFDGFYEVSSLGRVRSIDRIVRQGNKFNRLGGKILNPTPDRYGYLCCTLSCNGYRKQAKVHRMVAEAFIPNPYSKPEIDHINTIHTDNRVDNLRWATHKENNTNPITANHRQKSINSKSVQSQRMKSLKKKSSIKAPKEVYQYSLSGTYLRTFESISEAARKIGVTHVSIIYAMNNPKRSAAGYRWFSKWQE